MNIYLIIVLFFIIFSYLLNLIIELLNLRAIRLEIPSEFYGYYDEAKYALSQEYLKENTRFQILSSTILTSLTIIFIVTGGFNLVDKFARSFHLDSSFTGLIFAGTLVLLYELVNLPFSAYHTFVIEAKFGFNRSTPTVFFTDFLKKIFLEFAIGGPLFLIVIRFFEKYGRIGWVWCWFIVVAFEIFIMFIAPVVVFPLFNKFVPLKEGKVKDAIESYVRRQNFFLKGIFKMDASRRSAKSNAFFTGFGRYRRVVLYDTLLDKHSPEEIVAILAHEIGHYKKRHILKLIFISIINTGCMFFILSLFINNPYLFSAFRMEHISVYASLLFFGFLYTPLSILFSLIYNIFSRRYEYEADHFAVTTMDNPETFINALKKLSVDNLSNLTPHPLKVFWHYTHPPILERIEKIRKMISS